MQQTLMWRCDLQHWAHDVWFFFSVPAGFISDSKRLCLFRRHARTHMHSNMHNTKPMISTKNLGAHPNIGHQSKTDWQRAILIRSNARSPQGEPLPNPIHYCPLYPFHLLGFSTSLSLLPLYTAYMWTRVLSVYMIWERDTLPGGQLSAPRVCAL